MNQPLEVSKRDLVRAYEPWIFQSVDGTVIIKPYTSLPANSIGDFSIEDIERIRLLAERAYLDDKVGPIPGAGFSILGRHSLRFGVWDEEELRLSNFDLDYFSRTLVRADNNLSLNGAEVQIYAHENLAWRRFLESLRNQDNLEAYLVDTYVK